MEEISQMSDWIPIVDYQTGTIYSAAGNSITLIPEAIQNSVVLSGGRPDQIFLNPRSYAAMQSDLPWLRTNPATDWGYSSIWDNLEDPIVELRKTKAFKKFHK